MESYIHKQIHELLVNAVNPVFISDERVDGDSLGASLAMADFLSGFGKRVKVFVAEPIPEKYRLLPNIHLCTGDQSYFNDSSIDVVAVFDCSDEKFVQSLLSLIPGEPMVINIDHHPTNPHYGHVNQVLVDAPATAEIVHRFFEHNKIVPSKDAATCLLTGLCFDTTAFSNAATNERAFNTASSLVMRGARVQDVIRAMFQSRSISALRVWGIALGRLFQHPNLGYVSTCLTRKDIEENNVTDDEIDGLSNFLNLVTDTSTLFVLRETIDGNVKVSMRSLDRDVANIAKAFGGGGHKRAAGFTLENARLVERCGHWKVEKVSHS
jgi:bifunctional oligoribonuclease and PAP phosphatase NrnA